MTGPELALAAAWVRDAAEEGARDGEADVRIGTMIETPRAAVRANELTASAAFFSFGTNDLTQLVFGFSRDDVTPGSSSPTSSGASCRPTPSARSTATASGS